MAELLSIQSVPAGLLELLGMKGTGINPRTLESAVRATVDARQMFALARLSSPADGFNSGAAGTNALLVVPEGQWWIVLSVQGILRVDGAACTYLEGNVQLRYGAAGLLSVQRGVLTLGDNSALDDNQTMHIGWHAPEPVILRPGGAIAANIQWIRGAASADVAVQANIGVLS